MKAHVSCMVFGWLLCVTTGLFSARFMKAALSDGHPATWFLVHMGAQICGVVLTLVGVVTVWIKSQRLSFSDPHHKLGFAVTLAALLQTALALARPDKGTPWRAAWEVSHWWIGR